jgi:hypothetical protein
MRSVALSTFALLLVACGDAGDPVARLTASQAEVTLPHGRRVPLELRWEPLRPLAAGVTPVVFVHVLDAEGLVVRTFDHPFPAPWRPGTPVTDVVALQQSALAPALPAGDYSLAAGLYDGASERWPLATDVEEVARQEYRLARVVVPPNDARAPSFAFSEQWHPVEATGDRQTVARRWLAGDGTLEVTRLPGAADLVLAVSIPVIEPPLRVVLEPGASVPALAVLSECSGFAASVSGAGRHELRVPVPASGSCRVRLAPNFSVLEPGSPRKLAVALEHLAWELLPPGSEVPPPLEVPASTPQAAATAPP